MDYNGWKNKETWLVNVWYMDHMPEYFEDAMLPIDPEEIKEAITYMAEESEALSSLPAGLLSDFINTCWAEVDWYALADHLNAEIKLREADND